MVATLPLLPQYGGIIENALHISDSYRRPGLALFACVLENAGNEIRVKSSALALHAHDRWPDGSDESLLLGPQQHC